MKTKPCEQSWEIEALRDGRLSGASLSRVEGHIARCAACRETAETLTHLATEVARAGNGLDDLALRRLRSRVLRDADARLQRAPTAPRASTRRPWRMAGVVAALAACVVAALWLRPSDTAPGRAAPRVALRTARVEPSEGTVWSRNVADDLDRIVLVRGVIHVRVEHGRDAASVRVVTPDATIDDIGTVFTAEVRDGRTWSVRVDEGRVAITFTDGTYIGLGAGEAWHASDVGVVGDPPAAQRNPPEQDPPATVRGDGASRARAAGGAQATAPDEDADYLAVVAAERAGDAAVAERAARRYLDRHPGGFRRREVEALLAR